MSDRQLVTSGRLSLLWVSGADAVEFLDGLLSQNIAAIPIGGTGHTLLLAPNGKLRAILFVLRGTDRIGLICDRERADDAVADLRRFKIRVDAQIATDEREVWEIWDAAETTGTDIPGFGRWTETEGVIRVSVPLQRSPRRRVVVVGEWPGGEPATGDQAETRRIELGEAIVGVDLDDKTIPQEALEVSRYVDFEKGCYLGQELVARIETRGHVNRRLMGVVLAERPLPVVGSPIAVGDKPVGVVTSAAWSEERNRGVALAMLRAEVDAGSRVAVEGRDAQVVALPMNS